MPKGQKNEKREWAYDGLIADVREAGKDDKAVYVPINRNSLKECAVAAFVGKYANAKTGEVDIKGVITAMKAYHAANPEKAAKKYERALAAFEAAKADAEAAGLEVE
jgi:hypothetical protein